MNDIVGCGLVESVMWHKWFVLMSCLCFLDRWPLLLMFARGRWRSCCLCVLPMSSSSFLLKTVVHLVFASAKRPLQVPWCSVSFVEKFSTAAASQHPPTSSTARPGSARSASGRGSPRWTKCCRCWPRCRGSGSGCQKGTPCASSSRGRCDGSTEFSRPAPRGRWRKCLRRSVLLYLNRRMSWLLLII